MKSDREKKPLSASRLLLLAAAGLFGFAILSTVFVPADEAMMTVIGGAAFLLFLVPFVWLGEALQRHKEKREQTPPPPPADLFPPARTLVETKLVDLFWHRAHAFARQRKYAYFALRYDSGDIEFATVRVDSAKYRRLESYLPETEEPELNWEDIPSVR